MKANNLAKTMKANDLAKTISHYYFISKSIRYLLGRDK
ncbi:unnamed protein product [Brugia timori]|uniref:SsrA-binding protein n=1 Tax=Brugia timori TaxID=42155 RepID=A0A0R3QGH8_9BILA|nr:unnamed protein product [Brugia timori]